MSKARMSELLPEMLLEMDKETLIVKPIKPTPLQIAFKYKKEHPGCSKTEIQQHLELAGACLRSRGFEIANVVF